MVEGVLGKTSKEGVSVDPAHEGLMRRPRPQGLGFPQVVNSRRLSGVVFSGLGKKTL